MFSVENFYYVLYSKLLRPVKLFNFYYFKKFGSSDFKDLAGGFESTQHPSLVKNVKPVIFHDQEPIPEEKIKPTEGFAFSFSLGHRNHNYFSMVATSEYSDYQKNYLLKEFDFYHWYYFFHGFAALDWYRDFEFIDIDYPFDKPFLSFNNLCHNLRNYRLLLVALLKQRNILDKGYVSLGLFNHHTKPLNVELFSPWSRLSKQSKKIIYTELKDLKENLYIDIKDTHGALSARMGIEEYRVLKSGFVHVVTETVYYLKKLHLTEKIFKTVIAKRPFILVAAPGNLAYFKSYGFKTFDRWIDESYDTIEDDDLRMSAIIDQVERIANLSREDQLAMYEEMKETLEFNYQHMYGDFKKIITDELVDNFEGCLRQWNNGRLDDKSFDLTAVDFEQVKRDLLG